MNRHPVHLWALQLETILELGNRQVDSLHRQIVGQRAMAGDGNMPAESAPTAPANPPARAARDEESDGLRSPSHAPPPLHRAQRIRSPPARDPPQTPATCCADTAPPRIPLRQSSASTGRESHGSGSRRQTHPPPCTACVPAPSPDERRARATPARRPD